MDDVTLGTLAHGMPHVGGDPLTAAGGTLAPSLTGEQRQGGQSALVTLPAAEAGLETLSLYPGLPAGRRQQRTEAVLALARGQSHHFVEERDVMCTYETCPGGSKKRERKRDYREIKNAFVSLVNFDDLQLFSKDQCVLLDHTREQRKCPT